MKKFLSTFLAILMVLTMVATSMVTAFAAEEAEEVHSILISNGEDIAADQTKDVKSHGWRNHNGHEFTVMELDGQKAAAITVKSNASSTTPRFHYYSDTTVDLTKFTYVEFDFYISDLAKMTDGFKPGIELSSAGLQDKAEVAGDVTGVEWKAGWNHVKVALADIKNATPGDAGDFNPAAWNFMRILVGGTGTFKASESDPLILAIDNFGFSDGTETPAEKAEPLPTPVVTPTEKSVKEILVSNNAAEAFYDATKPGWAIGGGGQEYGNGWEEIEIDGKMGVATTLTGDGNVLNSRYHYYAVEPTDISGMTHLEMDLYISDASIVNGKQFIVELQDKGLWGHIAESESRYLTNNAQFHNGWNHIVLELDTDIAKWEAPPALNKTAWQHIRVWFPDAPYSLGDKTVTYAIGGLKFTNANYGEQSISVPLVKSTKPAGWNWKASLNIKKTGASAVATTVGANESYGTAGAFNANFSHAAGVDTTGATNFRFWLYTDDAATLKNVQVEMELTSGGTCDQQESAYLGTLDGFVAGGIQNGWNEVVVPFTSLDRKTGGETNWTKINFFRMYNNPFTSGANAMVVALDQLVFGNDAGETVAVFSDCDIATDWEGPTSPMELDGEVVVGNTWAAGTTLGAGWFMFRYGLNFEGKYPDPVDISGMKYIEFDLYVSDAMALINSGYSFELTSAGIQDKFENAYNWDAWRTNLDDGWNHIQWPLSWFKAVTEGTCDFTAWNFLRMFNAKDLVVGENGLTVAMKNVKFTTGNFYAVVEGETEKEEIVFTPVQSDKDNQANLDHVVKITSGANTEKFYADAEGEVIYRVPVSGKKYVKYVTLEMTTGAQLLLQASTDGENWTTIYEYKYARLTQNLQQNGGLEKGYYTYDLTDAVVGEKGLTGDYVYIRIADSYPAAGWGGNLYYTPVTLNIIRTPVPHEIQLPEYGTTLEGWNWGSSLNAAQGSFSASNTFKAGQTLGNANILAMYQSKDGKGVDASTADTFEFDFYVSNAAALKDIGIELELTSGKTPDNHEKRYVAGPLSGLIEGGMKDGWNHVVLPFSKMADMDANKIDWTNVNCFRQYFFAGVNTGDADLVVAYDNLIFTKDGKVVATLSDAEPDKNGWDAPAMDMDGELAIGATSTGKFDICAIYVNYVSKKDIDVTGMKYLEYDLYISNVDPIKNVTLYTEINSSGDFDKNELGYDKTFAAHGLKSGWNRIKIELSKMGDTAGQGACDLAAIKWFRVFTVDVVDGIDEITYAVANVRFTDDQAPEIELPENPTPDTPAGPPAADSELSVKDAIALGGSMEHNTYTEGKYYVTGVVTEVYNEKYGNMKITDAEGNILTIYGTYSADGSTRYDAMETKPVAGDTVTIYGIVGQYNGTPQIKNGWLTAHTPAGAPEETTKTDLYEFQIDNGPKEAPYLDPDYKANWNGSLRFADASQYFIYKFNLTAFRGVESITFAGNFGGSYHIWASADGKTWVEIAKRTETSPAVSLELDLSELADDVANTMTLYVKIGDAVTTDGNGGNMNGNVQLKVVYDKNADQTPIVPEVVMEHEKYEFMIGTEEEGKYLLNEGGSVLKTPDHDRRYADATKYFIYKYDVKNIHQIVSIIFKAKAEAQMKLEVSVDKENWINIDLSEFGIKNLGDRLGTNVYKFDITAIAEKLDDAHKTIYVKISDNKTDDGWGGCLVADSPVVLDIEYTPLTDAQKDELEATVTEHSIPLWGANKTWGDIYVTDNENQVAGSGCISANLKGVQGTHAPSKKFDAIDASGMDTFEFNLYLSDLAIVDHLKNNIGSGSVELCSGGTCDQAEKAVHLHQIFTDFVVGELTVGWNQIAIPLNKMASTPGTSGEFQITGINYIRIFWSGMTNPTDQDWIIKFDNFRMTDRQARKDAEYAEFVAATLEKYAGLIKNIESLKPISEAGLTAENFNSFKAKYSEAKAAFDNATEEEQAVISDCKTILVRAKNAIDAYQEKLDALKENAQLIADLQALEAYKDASAFTYENYDDAKAAIEAARAAVNALERKVRELLSDEGYVAILEAAEKAMPAQKPEAPKAPECTEHVDADNNGKCDNCDADVEKTPDDPNKPDDPSTPGDDKPTDEPKEEGGCKSALTIGAIATMILAGAWVTIAARKKED